MAKQDNVTDLLYTGPNSPIQPDKPQTPQKSQEPQEQGQLTKKQQLQQNCQTAGETLAEKATTQQAAQETFDKAQAALNKEASSMDPYNPKSPSEETAKEYREAKEALEAAAQETGTAQEAYDAAQSELDALKAMAELKRPFDKTYVVHMAEMKCSCGLPDIRPSYVKLAISHGIYIKGIPQMNVMDKYPNKNIIEVAGCKSLKNPLVKEAAEAAVKEAKKQAKENQSFSGKVCDFFLGEQEIDVDESLMEECVAQCVPVILATKEWSRGKKNVEIDGHAPLLRRSTLVCKYGGIITLDTSGQPE